MDWLHQDQPCQTKPCQTEPDLFCPFLSASLTPGTQDTSQSVYTNKKIWCRLAQSVPKNSWKRLVQEVRQKQQFFCLAPSGSIWLRLAWFCLARLVLV